jgi:hemerythrin
MIEWRKNYRLGIPAIDGEHLILLALLNQIEINIKTERAEECVEDVLASLLFYINFHFTNEEVRMTAAGYPGFEAHKAQHDALMKAVIEMKATVTADASSANRIRTFVFNWLMDHVFETDAKFAIFAQRQGRTA